MKKFKRNREEEQVSDAVETDDGFKRLKRKNTVRHYRRRIAFFLFLAVLVLVFLAVVTSVFFKVKEIRVKGNTVYVEEDIVKASGVIKDMNIYMVDEREVRGNLVEKFPYIRTVSVVRDLPNTVTLDLSLNSPDYYVEINGEFFVVSRELRVLGRYMSKDEVLAHHPAAIKITGGEIQSCIVGRDLEFVTKSYSDTAKEILSILRAAEIYEGVSSVDFSDKFNIYVVYDRRLKANIGGTDDVQLKLRFMHEIVKDLGEARGTIDLKSVEAGYVLLNTTEEYD